MKKGRLACCALCQLSGVSNNTPIEEFEYKLAQLKIEKDANTEVGITTGNGQTAAFVIVSPGEDRLKHNLIKLGFANIHTFERRVGYPDGLLGMYIKNI